MMLLFYTILSLFLIIAPFYYFLCIFKYMKKSGRYILYLCTSLSIVTILLKVLLKPSFDLWFNIVSFYILCSFLLMLCLLIYQLWCYIFNQSFQKRIIFICVFLSIFITGIGYYSHFHKNITHYNICIQKEASLDSLNIAFISDIHIDSGTTPQDIQNLVKQLNQKHYDLVISNSSPAASHKLVVILSDRKHISYSRWIQIWEDPWYYDLYGGHTERIKAEEHYLLQRASEVCYVSPLTLEYQKKYYRDCSFKMHCIPLPYLAISEQDTISIEDEISFGYFGDYFSKTRNLIPFYDALKSGKFKGYIYGDTDICLKNTDKIEISGRVTLNKLERIQRQTAVLVHVCNLRGGQIPGKIYHYSSTKKPILFILDGTEEEKKVIKSYFLKFHRYYFCENNKESIQEALLDISMNYKRYSGSRVTAFEPKVVVREFL